MSEPSGSQRLERSDRHDGLFQTIVVPADLTDRNRGAVEMASRLASPSGGKVYLLHVIETIPGFTVEEESDFYRRLERAASKHLNELAKPLREKKIEYEADVVYGTRAWTIVEEAAKLDADLIVIQSHRIEAESRPEGLGTLSYQVGIFAKCPVLLVK
jgi:nucleotide-binding universal stress UspA family protein